MKLKIKNKNNTQEEEKTERKQKGFRLKSETLIRNRTKTERSSDLNKCSKMRATIARWVISWERPNEDPKPDEY